ncbi:MAG: SDR family oxidoreductase [Bacteroidales bacterium]|nr:SDR family oxidoreductase [Bacteroidales bacterium]
MVGKVYIVTGASSGIGEAIALRAAEKGAKVVLAARSYDRLQEVIKIIKSKGGDAFCIKCDVSVEEDCKLLIEATIAKYGRIDVLINNAGISMRAKFEAVQLEVLQKIMDVNYWGTVYCTKYALPHLIASKGSVVGMSSIAGFKGLPGRTGYSASKFAMQGFLEAIRVEYLYDDLHVLIVCPGFTNTNIRKAALLYNGKPQGISPRKEKSLMSADSVALKTLKAIRQRRRLLILTLLGKATIAIQRFIPIKLDRMVYRQMAKEPDSPV